ncbi:aryl-alcohol dehydrogenase-like predicted oxidoreductase [Rhodococcus fascians]|jgi:aryl-alcohol dehydrogenase-like predicted oxidoreductase|uniref:aldo/keto reductase n=1 Tax=Nocardiaceae TaxID=85025 RepID=UPI00285DDDB0|nr:MULTISPECIES: aldo/keto reductase [Rhodococcus]MDR6909758.1 aryl-alcohol dehydrogenase-like predicted oxidoreductase [Rhodococcus sp. 3258]MDR6931596.1 aryl-alcohol dehydrogenase-like predicted oxidoreductase [Rhodococcus fascians]
MSIPTRNVPALGRNVGAIGLGCMGISWAYAGADTSSDTAGAPILAHALESGIDFFDTSDAYAAGHNERVVGRALAGTDAVIATKAGLIGNVDGGAPVLTRNGTPKHLAQACDSSLRNLGVDTIDLYYLHRVDDQVPIEESWGALSELVAAGKVRAVGLSEVTVEQARVAHSIHPVSAVQSELSLWTRNALGQGTTPDGEPMGNMVEWTSENDAVFVPFSPLGRGFLTGSLDTSTLPATDMRLALPRFSGAAAEQNRSIVQVVSAVASRHDSTPAAVALAWVLAQGPHVIPIPGTTNIEHFDANLAALELKLTAEDLTALDDAPAAVGTRY